MNKIRDNELVFPVLFGTLMILILVASIFSIKYTVPPGDSMVISAEEYSACKSK